MKVISQEGSAGYKDNLKEKKLETGERIKQQVFNFLIRYYIFVSPNYEVKIHKLCSLQPIARNTASIPGNITDSELISFSFC